MHMEPKEILYGQEAREKLAGGIHLVAKLLGFTHGPKGQKIIIENWDLPKVTTDGTEISADLQTDDPFENLGVNLAKEAIKKAQEACGDGASRTCILMDEIVMHAMRHIASDLSPVQVKQGMDFAAQALIKVLNKQTLSISERDIEKIATASAAGDEEVGCFIAEALQQAGSMGTVVVEEGRSVKTTVRLSRGMELKSGFQSSFFVTSTEALSAEYPNCLTLVIGEKIQSVHSLLPALQMAMTKGSPLLIFAEDFHEDVISTLVVNQVQGTLRSCAIKAPGLAEEKNQNLQDIALATGATLISEKTGLSLRHMNGDEFGGVKKAIVTKDSTTLIGGQGDSDLLDESVAAISKLVKNAPTEEIKEKLMHRMARLLGKVAIIEVGGTTEPEMKQKVHLFKESLKATKMAQQGGTVIGGGIALLEASKKVKTEMPPLAEAQKGGFLAVLSACSSPARQIIANSGQDPAMILSQIEEKGENSGFNTLTEKVENLNLAQIFDPKEVVEKSLLIAVSGAGNLIMTESAMAPVKQK